MTCLIKYFEIVIYSIKPFSQQPYGAGKPATAISGELDTGHPSAQASWEGRAIASNKFRLLEFSAFMEIQREEMVSVGFICKLSAIFDWIDYKFICSCGLIRCKLDLRHKLSHFRMFLMCLFCLFWVFFENSIVIYSFTSMESHRIQIHY